MASRRVQVDTVRELERLKGELAAETLRFDTGDGKQDVPVEVIQYYTNLEARTGTLGKGTLYLWDTNVLPNVQLVSAITIRMAGGLTATRGGEEIVMLNLDAGSF